MESKAVKGLNYTDQVILGTKMKLIYEEVHGLQWNSILGSL